MSEIDSNIDKNRRIIFKNPDGTYTYCNICGIYITIGYKSGERDSACETKGENIDKNTGESTNNNTNNTNSSQVLNQLNHGINTNNPNNYLYLSDDDLRYLVDSTTTDDFPALVEQLLDVFRRYRLVFTLITVFEMFLTFILTLLTWEKRETAITIMEEIYKDINSKEAASSFYALFVFTLCVNFVYYPFGFYALARKSVRLIRFYSFFIIFNAMFILLSIYINM